MLNETKESYGKLSFESFERGNMSGWHVRTRGYDSNGRMKTGNEIGYIELRKDIRKNEQQHFLWLERGNMEENIKVLNMWVKGTGKDFVGTKTQNQGSKGTSDNISFELGKLLPTVAAWITKNHPNLVEQKDELNTFLLEKSIPMPNLSADELYIKHYNKLTDKQKTFLKSFIARWLSVQVRSGGKLDYQNLEKEYKTWLSKNTLGVKKIKEETEQVDESATKGAIEDWMYDIPAGAIAELRKIKVDKNHKADITKILMKFKVKPLMGESGVDVIIDYWKTFFGEEAEMNELEEETHYDCWYKGKNIKVTATTSYDAQKKAAVIFKVTGKNQSNIRVHATGHSDYKNEAVSVDARRGEYHRTVNRLTQSREMREAKNKLNNNKYTGLYDDGSGKGASVPEPISFNKENNQRYQVEIDGRTKGYREALARVEMYKKMREASKKDKSKTLFGAQKESVEEIERLAESVEPVVEAGAVMVNGKFSMTEADLSPAQKKYREFFKKTLDKFDADSPADLDDSKKKEFFSFIKKNYKEEADDILPPHGKTLDEEELSSKQKEYRAFFSKALKKFDAKSPASLDDGKKKEFFSYVKKNWKG